MECTVEEYEEIVKLENKAYNQALEDAEKRYRKWSKSEHGKVVSDDALPIRVLRSLRNSGQKNSTSDLGYNPYRE